MPRLCMPIIHQPSDWKRVAEAQDDLAADNRSVESGRLASVERPRLMGAAVPEVELAKGAQRY
jgi:SH3-like domain-containing protein